MHAHFYSVLILWLNTQSILRVVLHCMDGRKVGEPKHVADVNDSIIF
jgi:hypothetical protein